MPGQVAYRPGLCPHRTEQWVEGWNIGRMEGWNGGIMDAKLPPPRSVSSQNGTRWKGGILEGWNGGIMDARPGCLPPRSVSSHNGTTWKGGILEEWKDGMVEEWMPGQVAYRPGLCPHRTELTGRMEG